MEIQEIVEAVGQIPHVCVIESTYPPVLHHDCEVQSVQISGGITVLLRYTSRILSDYEYLFTTDCVFCDKARYAKVKEWLRNTHITTKDKMVRQLLRDIPMRVKEAQIIAFKYFEVFEE